MKSVFRAGVNWLARKHPMVPVLPFITAQALATFPSKVGIVCSVVATALFLLCLLGWRVNSK
jgi:type III secretory pathway component EscT